jgi:hypothetical protein
MRSALLALLLTGCAYKVQLNVEPAGAEMLLPNGAIAVAPSEVKLRWVPFGHQRIRVTAPGYRPLEIDLRHSEIRAGHYVRDTLLRPSTLLGNPRGAVLLVLVPEHDGVGTWEPEDVP